MRCPLLTITCLALVSACSKGDHAGDKPTSTSAGSADHAGAAAPAATPTTRHETVKLDKLRRKLTVGVDLGTTWQPAKDIFGPPAWRPEGSRTTYLQVGWDCGGKCKVEAIPANIDNILKYKRDGYGTVGPTAEPIGPAAKDPPLTVELVTDEPRGLGHVIHRRLPAAKGFPARFDVLCVVRKDDTPFFAYLAAIGNQDEEAKFLPAIMKACESLAIDSWS